MVAILGVSKIDLNWAENQYWTTLFKVIREMTKMMTPKERKKVSASEMQKNFIKKGED